MFSTNAFQVLNAAKYINEFGRNGLVLFVLSFQDLLKQRFDRRGRCFISHSVVLFIKCALTQRAVFRLAGSLDPRPIRNC